MAIIIVPAHEVLATLEKRPVAAVLSIEVPGAQPGEQGRVPRIFEHGHGHVPQKILTFWDTERDDMAEAPDARQVEEGMRFVSGHLGRGDVIVHCLAGISRSAGLALGALALHFPDRPEKDLLSDLLALRPGAAPNILVVRHADHVAGRAGGLVRAVLSHPEMTLHREAAEQARREWAARNPQAAARFRPKP